MSLLIETASGSDAREGVSFLGCVCIEVVRPRLRGGDEGGGESIFPVAGPGIVGREMGIGRLGEGKVSFNADPELVSRRN